MESSKKCPYCGAEILAEAKKCRYCGEWLDKKVQKEPKAEVEQHYAFKEETIVNENQNEPETESEPQKMFSKPFSFNGRINRKEYILSILIGWSGAALLVNLVNLISPGSANESIAEGNYLGFVAIIPLYFFIAAGVKRCHDCGFSGWWLLYGITIFTLTLSPRVEEDNEYGPYIEY